MDANLKRHNRVEILSSKHTYLPMRVHPVAQSFYNEDVDMFGGFPSEVMFIVSC